MSVSGSVVIDGNKIAASDLSSKYGYAVKLNSSAAAALCDTAGEEVYGVLTNKPTANAAALIAVSGRVSAILAGTTVVGDKLTVDANGKFAVINAATNIAACAVAAVALQAGSAGDIAEVMLLRIPARMGVMSIPVNLASITGAGNIVTSLVMGFAGKFTKFDFITTVPVTTGSKAASLNLEIGGTDVTGGVIALTSATCTPIGAKVAGSAITALNNFAATDAIDIEAASVTAFAEGAGVLLLFYSQT